MSTSGDSSKLGLFGLVIFTTFLISGAIPQQLLAAEVKQDKLNEKEHKPVELALSSHQVGGIDVVSSISYNATDLQRESASPLGQEQLLARKVDLDTLCKMFPHNSRCAKQKSPEQPMQEQPTAKPVAAKQLSPYAFTTNVSTLGIGVEGVRSLSPNFNGRLGVNYFSFGQDIDESDVEYNADLQLLNVSALGDWYPFKGNGLHFTAGLVFNDNRADATARLRPGEQVEIGDQSFTTEQLGKLKGEVSFSNPVAPYIGIGYGNPARQGRRFGFSVNVGVMFPGSPQVDLNASKATVNSVLAEEIRREEKDLEDDLSGFSVYPVVSLGFDYHF